MRWQEKVVYPIIFVLALCWWFIKPIFDWFYRLLGI